MRRHKPLPRRKRSGLRQHGVVATNLPAGRRVKADDVAVEVVVRPDHVAAANWRIGQLQLARCPLDDSRRRASREVPA